MTNLVVPLTILALLGGSVVYGDAKLKDKHASVETTQSKQSFASVQNEWLFSNDTTQDICLITKTHRISSTTYLLDIDPTCEGVLTGSHEINVWQQDKQGNVSLSDEQGNTIAEFNYESKHGLTTMEDAKLKLYLTPNG